jgi:hypothetical protein
MSNWLTMNPSAMADVCIEIDDLLDGYVVGALDSDDMLRVAQLIDQCPEQASRLAQLEETVGMMGLAIAPVAPPPELWDRIAASTQIAPANGPIELAAKRAERQVTVPRWVATLVSAAAILLLITSVSLGMALRDQGDEELGTMPDFESAMTTYMTSGGEMLAFNTWAAPEYMTWPGKGTLLTAPDMPAMVFVDECLPTDNSGISYYVWVEKDGVRTPMGEMTIDEDGQGILPLEGIESIDGYDAIGISIKTREDKVYDLMEGWPASEG